jgi:hypothetical protein
MTDTFRALSSRLLAALKTWSPAGGGPLEGAEEQYEAALIAEADAALAQPEPQGPSELELETIELKLWDKHRTKGYMGEEFMYDNDFSAALDEYRGLLAQPEPQGPTQAELRTFACKWWHSFGFVKNKATCTWVIDQIAPEHFVDFSRDLLARWGRPAIEPVPVSERLPVPEDCDAEGRCWFFHTSTIGGNEWFLSQLPKVSEWYRWQSITHWLPHWALPVPGVEGADA